MSGRSCRYRLQGIRAKTAQTRRGPRSERLKGCRRGANALHVIRKSTVPAVTVRRSHMVTLGRGLRRNPLNPAWRAAEPHYSRPVEQGLRTAFAVMLH
jgi:hypothetical protein